MSRYDVVVVGSGPGGAVTARTLAEAGARVLVLEEGPAVEPGRVPAYSSEQMRAQYRSSGLTVALGTPSVTYAEGCCLGGGSEVNSGLYHRPSAELLQEWSRARSIEALDAATLAPWHDLVEREIGVSAWPDEAVPASARVLRRGAERLGWQGLDVPRWVRYRTDGTAPVAEKQTMSRTYLPAARAAGAEVRTGSRVRRVLRAGDRATGVEVEHGEVVHADAVVVAGGAVQTPALLQRSGWRRNIGTGFSVHPTVKAVAELDEPVDDVDEVGGYQVKEFGSWLSIGSSASRPELLALALADNWPRFGGALEHWRRLTTYYAAIQSVGTGRVRAVPGLADPVVTYRLTGTDRRRLASALGRLLHVALAAGARRVLPSYAGAPVVTDAVSAALAIKAFRVPRASLMTVHLTGTAAMGEDRRRAATDSFGRVHGAQQLWVNDASLLPWAPGINPQGTLMAVAHRNAARLVDHLGGTP